MKIFTFSFRFIYSFIGIILFVLLSITYLSKLSGDTITFFGENLVYVCEYKNFTGKECGSCGLSRSWVSLSNFEFQKSKNYNNSGPKTFFFSHLFLLVFLVVLLLKKLKFSQKNIVLIFLQFSSILMLIFAWSDIILKNIRMETYSIY